MRASSSPTASWTNYWNSWTRTTRCPPPSPTLRLPACVRAAPGPLPACSPCRAQILVGSWSADLLTSTGHLVRGEVHPDLRLLVLPAKMLQNTLAPLARAPPASSLELMH